MTYLPQRLLYISLVILAGCVFGANPQDTGPPRPTANLRPSWDYVDNTGKTVAVEFSAALPFSEGIAAVEVCSKNGLPYPLTGSRLLCLWGYVDKTGTYTITPRYIAAFPFISGVARYWTGAWTTIDKYGIIDKTGREIVPPMFDNIRADFFEGLAPFRIGNKWGFVDTNGRIIVSPRFSGADRFSDGVAPVALKNEHDVFVWGFADRTGSYTVEPRFSRVSKFSEGLASVTEFSGKSGYVDKTGRLVIKPRFDSAGDFSNGTAQVLLRTNKMYLDVHGLRVKRYKEGTIDRRGRYIVKPRLQPILGR